MSGALLSFLLMAFAGRELSKEISLFEIMFLRNLICMAILVGLLTRLGWARVRTSRPLRHLARNTIHYAAIYAWFFAVAAIPLAEVFAIEFTAPIWTALLASLFLRERLTPWRVVGIALGFTGVLIILRPGIAIIHPASFAALGAALGYAMVYVITKDLISYDGPLTIVFWMNLMQLVLGLAPSLYAWTTPSPAMWPWVLVVGISGLSSHYCLSRALAYADATVVTPLDFLRLPLAAVVAWLAYAEVLDPYVFLGAAVIFAGNWLSIRRG